MTQAFLWALTGLSILGTVLNITKRPASFVIWLITNLCWGVYNAMIHAWPQACLFSVYAALAIWGIIAWQKSP